jgi:signal transduction histidine kinase
MFIKNRFDRFSGLTSWFINTAMPAFLVMVVLIFGVITITLYIDDVIEDRRSSVINRHAREAATRLQTRLNGYKDLFGGTRIISVNINEEREAKTAAWQEFWDILQSTERHEGIKSIGYAQIVPDDDLENHITEMRQQGGLGTYTLNTGQDKSVYAPITHVAPKESVDEAGAIGFDLFSIDKAQESLEVSKQTDEVNIIDIRESELLLFFDESLDIDFLLVMPIHRSDEAQEAEGDFVGYTYAAISSQEFFGGLMDDNTSSVYDLHLIAPTKTKRLYQSDDEAMNETSRETRKATDKVLFADKAITVTATNTQPLIPLRESYRPLATLVAGMTLTFFVTAFIYTLTQIRIRKQRDMEISDVNKAKDELLALASHQLRTPATGVKQYLGMLREGYAGKLSKSQVNLIEQAYESNERQLVTVNELLFVARLDSGRITLDCESINTKLLLEGIVQEQQPSIQEKKQQVDIRFPDDDVIIEADEGYLRMALENIVGNASKYTPEKGKITIWVTKEQDYVNIHVKDTGVGVSDEDMELLFKKFSRVDNDLSNQVAGTGIGLYLTKKIIEAHGGEITFESKLKKGSTVTVSLPIENASNTEKQLNISQ